MLTRIKDLIEELQQYNENTIVLYAYNEYGRHGIHSFIEQGTLVCCDLDGNVKEDDDGDLILRYSDDEDDEYIEGFPSKNDPNLQWLPAIKLFCQ